jgi:hypothetical protein
MNTERAPTDCHRPIREWQTEYDDQGGREGWMVTLERGHRYWLGAETSDGRPDDVWCQFCETRAGHPVENDEEALRRPIGVLCSGRQKIGRIK